MRKKIVSAILCAVMVVLPLTGCGISDNTAVGGDATLVHHLDLEPEADQA